eukprot:3598448-Amphidinium_carterae.1
MKLRGFWAWVWGEKQSSALIAGHNYRFLGPSRASRHDWLHHVRGVLLQLTHGRWKTTLRRTELR